MLLFFSSPLDNGWSLHVVGSELDGWPAELRPMKLPFSEVVSLLIEYESGADSFGVDWLLRTFEV